MSTVNVSSPRLVKTTDWAKWTPPIQATLVFLIQDNQVLLIHKKTGLGQGKVNAPGGKREGSESFLECACRELSEEVGLSASNLVETAHLRFLMSDHPDLECKVFIGSSFQGELKSTHEAHPFWCAQKQIPWEQMWQDDHLWLPLVLKGHYVDAFFAFDQETLLDYTLNSYPRP